MARILVIEDDEGVRSTMRELLQRAGHAVIDAANGRDGAAIFKDNVVDLVITDMIMPEQEGVETIQQILADRPATRIIAMSGGGRAKYFGFLGVAKALGALHTLTKPFTRQQLLETVEQCLKEPPPDEGGEDEGEEENGRQP